MSNPISHVSLRRRSGLWSCAALTPALLLVLAGGAPALGQNALGDGRGLDAGLSTTQGKTNPKGRDDATAQVRLQNQIISGQAGGGKSFQGGVPYRATNEFGGPQGSASLYNFRRDSASSDLGSASLSTSDALRVQFAMTSGEKVPVSVKSMFATTRGDVVSTGYNSAGLDTLRSVSLFEARAAQLPSVIGYASDKDNNHKAVTASSLRGVSYVSLDANDRGSGLSGMERTAMGVTPLSQLPDNSLSDKDKAKKEKERNPDAVQPIDTRVDTQPDQYQVVLQKLSNAIDARTGAPVNPNETKPGENKPGENKPGETPAPGENKETDPNAPKDANGKPLPAAPAYIKELEDLRKRLSKEQADREKAAASAKNAPPKPGEASAEEKPKSADLNPLPKTDDSLVDALKKMQSRIDTFGGNPELAKTNYERHMAEGEKAMAKHSYFDAEAEFSLALSAKPGDVMSQVGRVHAQVAAGLYLSAAGNLRDLLTAHPEMMPTRYGSSLLPTPERAIVLAEKLSSDLAKPGSALGADGALLLAYLGVQFDNSDWVKNGLEELRKRTPESDEAGRNLVDVLDRVWAKS